MIQDGSEVWELARILDFSCQGCILSVSLFVSISFKTVSMKAVIVLIDNIELVLCIDKTR